MDFFKFIPSESVEPSFLEQGAYINGIRSATWIERYRDPGEFTIKAPVSSGLRTFLPLGTVISHVATREAMMVETQEIDEDTYEEPMIEIKGTSLEAWLDNRSVGGDTEEDGGLVVFLSDYVLPFDTTWEQATDLINWHINIGPGGTPLINPEDEALGFTAISNQQHIGTSVGAAARIVRRGPLHQRLLELLAIDDFGIKVVRPNPGNANPLVTEFRIHNGVDRRDSVIFSHAFGDLKRPRYFWSNKNYKNDAHVVSTYNEIRFTGAPPGYNCRILYVDASDIDSQWTDWPTGSDRSDILAAMFNRAVDAIAASRNTALLATDISTTRYAFRTDYDVGDLVTVNGNYDVSSLMRVTEYVEFQDENGETGYPTLSAAVE